MSNKNSSVNSIVKWLDIRALYADLPRFRYGLYHIQAPLPWTNFLIFLYLSFLICTMEIIIVPTLQGFYED